MGQCEAMLSYRAQYGRKPRPWFQQNRRCSFKAKVEIDWKRLCRVHAYHYQIIPRETVTNRIDTDIGYMIVAATMALRATCNRAKVGAVLVRDRRIISVGYNGPPSGQPHCIDVGCEIDENTGGCLRSIHAEANAILWAARNGIAVEGATLYTTYHPCLYCARIIHGAAIPRVVYLEEYRDGQRGQWLINSEPLRMTGTNHPFLGFGWPNSCLLCGEAFHAHS